MKMNRTITAVAMGCLLFVAGIFSAVGQPTGAISSTPVFVPDYSHAGQPMPDGVLDWDSIMKSVDVTDGDDYAHFQFTFTNVARTVAVAQTTNSNHGGYEIASSTTDTPSRVVILSVHPSCGCTTAELPPTPWIIPPGSNGLIKAKVDLAGKSGFLIKQITVTTDHGQKNLTLRITIHPAPAVMLSDAQKMAGINASKADRQAIFRGDCASCHIKKIAGLNGPQLYAAVCGICHEAENRASMVPDLNNLKVATNPEFWRTWITYGKPGSLMPAFANSQGGPLTDFQVASLAMYLNTIHPSKAPSLPQ